MKKKIVIYCISECPITASNEEFINNICTFISNKKHIQDYIVNRSIVKNWDHYVSWLECHDKKDDKQSKYDYISMCLGWQKTFSKFCVKKQVYNSDGIATILRILNHCLETPSSIGLPLRRCDFAARVTGVSAIEFASFESVLPVHGEIISRSRSFFGPIGSAEARSAIIL